MRTKQELYQTAMRTVSARRQIARARAEEQRTKVAAAVPGFTTAEENIRRCGIQAALCAAKGTGISGAKDAMQAAKASRDALLASYGWPANCLEPKFTCAACSDTGLQNGHTCTCVRSLMQQMRREEIEKNSSLRIQSFDTLKLEYYPDEKEPSGSRTVRRYMQGVLEDLRSYADEFDSESTNLLLFGNAGLGKTHTALAIAGEVLKKGYDVIYVSSPEFFGRIEELYFGNDPTGEREAILEAASHADLFILDDLGTETVSSYTISMLYTLLNARMNARKPTIFTTNITDGTVLEKRYTEKISSRLWGACEPFRFLGNDIRVLKAMQD